MPPVKSPSPDTRVGYTIRLEGDLLNDLRGESGALLRSINQHIVWVLENRKQIPSLGSQLRAMKRSRADAEAAEND